MLKNYLRVALRNLTKYKAFSLINISGFAVGIACCIAILLYMNDELSYDRFNVHANQIYRLAIHGRLDSHELDGAISPSIMGPSLYKDLPEIASYTRLVGTMHMGTPLIRYNGKAFVETKFIWADSTFFDVFTCNVIAGNMKTALAQPNTVVITRSTARKYFGDENPMGKALNADRQHDYIVTGVVEDLPSNAHFHFDFIGSLTTFEDSRNPFWLSNNYYTYILLRDGTNINDFQLKVNNEAREHIGPQLKAAMGITYEQFEAAGNQYGYVLQPLTSIHLYSHLDYELEPNGNMSYVYIFSAIAIAILLIACINFINLSTARSERRAKEVCIRKSLGSSRAKLIWQFIAESVMTSTIAVFFAVVLVELFLPVFNDLTNKNVHLELLDSAFTIPALLVLSLLVGLISGFYPAFYLSSFQPVQVLKSGVKREGRKSLLRSGLVIVQFVVSITLFISTLVIYDQLKFIQNKDLGFNKEQVIIIKHGEHLGGQIQAFKLAAAQDSRVLAVSISDAVPGDQAGDDPYKLEGAPIQQTRSIRTMRSDFDFSKTYQMRLTVGRYFSGDHPSDTLAIILNEAALRTIGVGDPVGKHIAGPSGVPMYEIIGIVKDFNFQSLHEPVQPLAIRFFRAQEYRYNRQIVSIRIAPGDPRQVIAFLESTWKKFAGDETFDYSFLDQNLQNLYTIDQRTNRIVTSFSLLALFIASLGLLGLAAFVTEQRTKEIGMRKVLGASVVEIMMLLSKEFIKWVLIANVIAWPLAYYIMNNWLKNFAYRTDLSVWIFAASGFVVMLLALLTVSSHAIKAATANPIESLRYE